MATVTRVGIFSFSKLNALLGIFGGLIIGLFFTIFAMLNVAGTGASVIYKFAIIIFPIIYGIIGFIGGAVYAAIMNLGLRMTKGLEIHFLEE